MGIPRLIARISAAAVATVARRAARGPRLAGWGLALELAVETQRAALEVLLHMEPARVRRLMERLARPGPAGGPAQARPSPLAGIPALRVEPRDGAEGARVLYFHGGGYVLGSPASHRPLVERLALASGACVWSVDYRLAPEHPFPAAVDDAETAWRALLADGVEPGRVVLGGDSAGGNLVLALLQRARSVGLPLPAGAVLLSPWLDLEAAGGTFESHAATDYLTREMALSWSDLYRKGHDPRDPAVSPLHMDLAGMPPLLVQAGGAEVLLAELERFAAAARAAGAPVELSTYPGMPHVWHNLTFLPESRLAVEEAGRFVRERAKSPQRSTPSAQ